MSERRTRETPDPAPEPSPQQGETPPPPAPPGQDLTPTRGPQETEAEYLARTRAAPVESQSPTDVVPNTPQIRPFPTEAPPEEPAAEAPPAPSPAEPEEEESA